MTKTSSRMQTIVVGSQCHDSDLGCYETEHRKF